MQIGAYTLRDVVEGSGLVATCSGGSVMVIPYASDFNSPGIYLSLTGRPTAKVASLAAAERKMVDAGLDRWPLAVFDNLDLELRRFIQSH